MLLQTLVFVGTYQVQELASFHFRMWYFLIFRGSLKFYIKIVYRYIQKGSDTDSIWIMFQVKNKKTMYKLGHCRSKTTIYLVYIVLQLKLLNAI